MGKKIQKSKLLDGIKSQIEKCMEYQKKDPDKSAQKRVKLLQKNPVNLGRFYVNVTLKSPDVAQITDMDERLKKAVQMKKLFVVNDLNNVYEAGAIVEATISKDKLTLNATPYGSYDALMSALMQKYFDKTKMLMPLRPKKPTFGNNYISDDVLTAQAAGKKTIVYSIARFSLKSIRKILEGTFDMKKFRTTLVQHDERYANDLRQHDDENVP